MPPVAKQKAYRYGLLAECLAMFLLTCKGYRLLAWRHKTPVGEIDLIATRGRYLIFIEVKARKNPLHLYDALSESQQERIHHAALYFINQRPRYLRRIPRFDLIIARGFSLRHIPQAW